MDEPSRYLGMNITAEIAEQEFDALMRVYRRLKITICHDTDWLRYRILIHPQILDAIVSSAGIRKLCKTIFPSGSARHSIYGMLILSEPTVEGWRLIDLTADHHGECTRDLELISR